MAYQYDEMGNVVGEYESEEERRRRESIEQPVKQTITYNPDGSQEMTIKGTPQALSAANPYTPTVSGPVAPDQTYNRMLQAESNNRDYDAQGRPITSPAGAMFASQVMPATARQPGYGVRPAQSQTPEEYNRVGREYYNALLRQFGGDEQKAAAAYNAGPGRVQQNIRANQGQLNVAQLPQETQGYLGKIFKNVGNVVEGMIPSAQAGTLPPQAAPQAAPVAQAAPVRQAPPDSVINNQVAAYEARQPQNQYSLATGQTGVGLRAPTTAPTTEQPAIDTRLFDFYQRNQDNPQALITMGFSDAPGMPDFLKDRMKNRAAELIQQQREEAQAKREIPNMTESEIARALREKTTGGSYIKAALFSMLGMDQSAQAEAAKLGLGKDTFTQINGQPALVKLAANGTPIEGYNAATGKKLTAEELVTAAQYGTAQKGAQTHTGKMQDMRTGEVYYERTTPQGIELVDNNGKKYTGPSQNLRPFGIGSDIATRNQIQINELTNKLAFAGPTERARIVAESEAKYGPLDPAMRAQLLGQVTGTVPAQTTQTPQVAAPAPQVAAPAPQVAAPAAGTVAPTQVTGPVAPGAMPAPVAGQTPAQREIQQVARREEAEKVGQDLGTIRANQPKAEEAADYLITKVDELVTHPGFKFSVGIADAGGIPLPGAGKIAGMIPGTDTSDWAARFKEVQGRQFLQAVETLRGTGAISNQEGESAKAAIARMSTSQSEEEFKTAIKDFKGIVQRGIDNNRIKLGQNQKYGTGPASETSTAAPLSPADKARAELERRKKEKKG